MNNIDITPRLAAASRYHAFLSKHIESSWLDALEEVTSNADTGIPEVMVLLHPRWHKELGFEAANDPRGLNSFTSASSRARCRSKEIWGYDCPYVDDKIHVDHTFPFARGGASKNDNAMYLCREHNLSKSTDLHLVPWETFVDRQWIVEALEQFLVMGRRLTNEELYLPKSSMRRL
jgi:hypothetical protein